MARAARRRAAAAPIAASLVAALLHGCAARDPWPIAADVIGAANREASSARGSSAGSAAPGETGAGATPSSPAVDDLDPASLALVAERTASQLEKMPASREFTAGGRRVRADQLAASARHVAAVARAGSSSREVTGTLLRDCRALRVDTPASVTAYFEPVLAARRRADVRFRFPVYAMPSDAQLGACRDKLGRVPTRADIDGGGALEGAGLELAWVDDPVALFFLHVQGSGRLVFDDGTTTRVGFAGTNGLAYRSVGAAMLRDGLLAPGDATATAMRRWLAANPARRDAVLFANPRYVFFRDTGAEGPVGALGATLVAGRSVATDEAHVPRGMMAWLESTWPVVDAAGRATTRRPLSRFVFAQDAGAAITGAARLDVFAGSGDAAGLEAGAVHEKGELFLLLCPRATKTARP